MFDEIDQERIDSIKKRAKQVIVEYNTDVTDTIHIGTPDTSNNKAR